ncbi:MAG: hypothetical protein CVV23_04075 [Ignavibacteriae bacterium HGW-Ignavibacteriae-2]|jgi:tetratricopeptide (TPR) repeat protein|nr:tetratricopeptide repeat protein [Bacteroidota bacterium]PKL89657.1 MAG: hypothetical protein CVV23_04075 [Ignavibacteriae bacterium HGW-Ignavibacteriae-2]
MTKKVLLIFSVFLLAANFLFAQEKAMDPEAAKLYNQGNKFVKSGQFQGALENYEAALKIQKHPNIYYQKSVVYKKMRNFDQAVESYKKCLELDPKFIIAYNGLGTTYYSLERFEDAIANFEKYIELNKDKKQNKTTEKYISYAYTKLGQSAQRDGKFELAVQMLKKAVANYDYDAAYLSLAEVNIALGSYDDALAAADKAINTRTASSSISKGAPYYYKGLAFKGKTDIAKAKENFLISLKDNQYKANSQYELNQLK